jgi:hypothetical protein
MPVVLKLISAISAKQKVMKIAAQILLCVDYFIFTDVGNLKRYSDGYGTGGRGLILGRGKRFPLLHSVQFGSQPAIQ